MMSSTEEDFELELRSLPGVLNVGIKHRDNGDVEGVTLVVFGQDPGAVRVIAMQIVSLYYPDARSSSRTSTTFPCPPAAMCRGSRSCGPISTRTMAPAKCT